MALPAARALVWALRLAIVAPRALPPHILQGISIVEVASLHGKAATDKSFDENRNAAYMELMLPRGVDPGQAIADLTRDEILTTWKTGQKIVVPHRGDTGLHGDRYYPELSMAALHRVYRTLGIKIAEVDLTPIKDGSFILAHERNANRMIGSGVNWADLSPEQIKDMRLGFRSVDKDGSLQKIVYTTDQQIPTLEHFIAEEILCVAGANVILDARDAEDPIAAVATLSHRPELASKVAVQVYNLGCDSAEDFVRKVEKSNPDRDWKKRVMIIPVVRHEGMHMIAGLDIDSPNFEVLQKANFEWLNSWSEAGLNIPGYGLTVQGGFQLVDQETHKVNVTRFKKQFGREPTAADEADLVKDHLLDVMIKERKSCEPWRFIIVTSSAPTTNAGGDLFRVRFRAQGALAEEMEKLDMNNVKDWMFMEAAKAGAAFEHGGDFSITDQTVREVSYHAWIKKGMEPPAELRDPKYPSFSQENFLDAFLKKQNLGDES